MIRKVVFTVFVMLNVLNCFGQETTKDTRFLLLSNKNTNRTHKIHKRTTISVRIDRYESYKGRLSIVNDSTILVSSDTILLKNIDQIKYPTPGKIAVGIILIVPGAILMAVGASNMIQAKCTDCIQYGAGLIGFVFGVLPTAIGIANIAVDKKFYRVNWDMSIDQKTLTR
jgi:hypothetical protein